MNTPSNPTAHEPGDPATDALIGELIRDLPIDPLDQVEGHIAAAMAVFDVESVGGNPTTAGTRLSGRSRWLAVAAATVAVLVGVSAWALGGSDHDAVDTATAGVPVTTSASANSNQPAQREAESGPVNGGAAGRATDKSLSGAAPSAATPRGQADLGSFDTLDQLIRAASSLTFPEGVADPTGPGADGSISACASFLAAGDQVIGHAAVAGVAVVVVRTETSGAVSARRTADCSVVS